MRLVRFSKAYNDLVHKKLIDPCMGRVLPFDQIGLAHQEMKDGVAANGNTAILVGAPRAGLCRKA